MFIKVGRQGATTSQIAGAASGTHKHDIENTTLSVAKEYLYSFKKIQHLSGVVWCLTKTAAKEHKKTVHRDQNKIHFWYKQKSVEKRYNGINTNIKKGKGINASTEEYRH